MPKSEAELLARDCWPRWRRRGEFDRRVRWRGEGESGGARRLRRGEAARERASECTGFSRSRRAQAGCDARRRHGRRWRGSRRRYLGSAGGTGTSTTCRRARRSCGRTITGRGGGEAANLAGGCGGAARGRVGELGAGGEERQRGRVQVSAVASAEVGGRVGAGAGRLRRAAASTAHGRHAAGMLCRGRRVRERRAGERRGAGLARHAASGDAG